MSEHTSMENTSVEKTNKEAKSVKVEAEALGRKTITVTKDDNRIFTFDYPGDAGVAELELISFSLFSKIFNYKYDVPVKLTEKKTEKVENKPEEKKDLKE